MEPKPRTRRWPVVLAVLAAPFVAHALIEAVYLLQYAGTCGPHAPDIPKHACTFPEYAAEWGAGFAFFGVVLLDAVGTGVLLLLGLAIRLALRRRQRAV